MKKLNYADHMEEGINEALEDVVIECGDERK